MERCPPSSTEYMTRQTYLNAGLRTQDCTLGAIPPQAFLDKFLPSRLDVSLQVQVSSLKIDLHRTPVARVAQTKEQSAPAVH